MNRPCYLHPSLRTMLFVVWQPPPTLHWLMNKPCNLFTGLRTVSFFVIVWQSPCYIDWWTDLVTFSLVLEPCCLLSDCRPVTLVDEVSVTWSLVLEPCCLLSDCRPVTLVDEQTPSLISWSQNHVVFCLTVSLLHWLTNRLCRLVPGVRKIFCVGSRTEWWANPTT
jgi:hypothetical protein